MIYKGLMEFWKVILIIFSVVKVVKCLILVGLLEVGIEVIVRVKCLGNADFIRGLWMEQICHSWLPAACPKM